MDDQYFETQKKIIEKLEKFDEEISKTGEIRAWKKFIGDVCVRLLKAFIERELPEGYVITQPYAYIQGFPTEFDLLIVRKKAKPMEYTNVYNPKEVVIGLEIKKGGIYSSKNYLEKSIEKIKDNFNRVKKKYNHINFIYLTISEVTKTKRRNAINYFEITKKGLSPYKAYCLKDSRTGELFPDGWRDFISYIKELISRDKER